MMTNTTIYTQGISSLKHASSILKNRNRISKPTNFAYVFYCLIGAMMLLTQACNNSKDNLTAGVSVANINPSIGAYIAGDKQNRKFTALHDSLYAKAVVISKDNSHIAIVTLDCIGLLNLDVLRIREKVAQLCDFPKERVIITSTHTHAGPDVVGIWGSDYMHSGVDSLYMNFLVNTAAQQVQKAFNQRQPVSIAIAETTFGEPWVQNICKEEIDRSVTILQIKDKAQKNLATLTNFACHPTFMDAVASQISADYVHGYYETIKKTLGGEALFLQGAIGGWIQPENEAKTFENAFKRGKELAETVVNALKNAKTEDVDKINFKSKKFCFMVENANWKQLSAIGTIKNTMNDSVNTEISWFAIGKAQFLTHPGETAPYYGLESKKMMGDGPKFIIGLGNDALGYIIKPQYFENPKLPHAEYLTSMSLGKPTGPKLLKCIEEMMAK